MLSLRSLLTKSVPLVAGLLLASCTEAEDTATTIQAASNQSRVFVGFAANGKTAVKAAVAGLGGQLHYEFDDLGVIAVTLPTAALNGLANNPKVTSIEEDPPRYKFGSGLAESPPYGLAKVEADKMHTAGFKGTGVKVCVIDSGLKMHGNVALPGSTITPLPGNLPADQDGDGHGTHVANTIAGQATGVAPEASLLIMRVFGDNGAWAYASSLVDASKKCKDAGAKIISMSLGGSNRSAAEDKQFASLLTGGILSIAAAGNGGTAQISYPAGYTSVVSVAATDINNAKATFSQYNKDVELAAPGVAVWSVVPFIKEAFVTIPTETATSTLSSNHLEGGAFATATATLVNGGLCDTAFVATGAVVHCARGVVSFATKVNNAFDAGAVGVIISNNEPGNFLGTMGDGVSSTLPAVTVSQADGAALVALAAGTSVTVTSTNDTTQNGYEAWNGTSMATPHVSGAAALVWGACPTATVANVRLKLQSTALDLGAAKRDVQYGFGLVRACTAAKSLCNAACTP